MGYAARANKSAETAAAAGHRKPERVTVARVRTQRRGELRGHLASMVAMQAILGMMEGRERSVDVELAGRLGGLLAMRRGGLRIVRVPDDDETVNRSPEPDARENVSGANALQRDDTTAAETAQ